MILQVTTETVRQFIEKVSDQQVSMAGAVIAVAAAQAAALGEACMQISLDHQVDQLDWQDVTARIEQMVHLKNSLLEWCDQDAAATIDYATVRNTADVRRVRQLLCDSPVEIGRLALEAAQQLQDFRPLVFAQVQDDLELALHLLVSTARAAQLLLASHLRQWPDPALLAKFEPLLLDLETKIGQLSPVQRIWTGRDSSMSLS
ncbi:MAG: cyclodeaminase/cyclohydrolase family protein [Chloroflexota bacterium]